MSTVDEDWKSILDALDTANRRTRINSPRGQTIEVSEYDLSILRDAVDLNEEPNHLGVRKNVIVLDSGNESILRLVDSGLARLGVQYPAGKQYIHATKSGIDLVKIKNEEAERKLWKIGKNSDYRQFCKMLKRAGIKCRKEKESELIRISIKSDNMEDRYTYVYFSRKDGSLNSVEAE